MYIQSPRRDGEAEESRKESQRANSGKWKVLGFESRRTEEVSSIGARNPRDNHAPYTLAIQLANGYTLLATRARTSDLQSE